MTIKGQNFRVLVGGTVIAKATSCTITFTGNTEDVTTKDDSALFSSEAVTTKTWQVQVDTFDDASIGTMLTTFKSKTKLALSWDVTTGDTNSTVTGSDYAYEGYGFMTDATFTFNDRAVVATSVTYTGTGAFTKIDT